MCNFSCNNGLLSGPNGADNVIGHYAVSLAGHDSGKIYLVVGVSAGAKNAGELLLCNGKSRPMGKPKLKKRRHAAVLRERDDGIAKVLLSGGRPDDSMIIRKLKEFGKSRNCD